jgi:2-methylcitrate dehydratase PrpD
LALTRRVRVFHDPRVEANYPGLLSGSLKVVMRDGTAHESFQRVPKGDPENFVTAEEVRRKYASLVRPCLGDTGEVTLFNVAMQLEAHNAADLFAATMPREPLRAAG